MKSMQAYYLRLATTVLTLACLAACSSREDDPQASTGMSWTVDGISTTDLSPQVVSSSTNIDIVGSPRNAPNITTLHLGMPAQAGTYTINSTGAVAADYSQRGSTATVSYLASTGTVTVSSLTTTRVTGSFSFTAYNYSAGVGNPLTKTITNGRFDVAR